MRDGKSDLACVIPGGVIMVEGLNGIGMQMAGNDMAWRTDQGNDE